jgi:hypothetical protein
VIGGISLLFKSADTAQYTIPFCTVSYTDLPVSLPSVANKKVWRITQSRTSGAIKLQIHCDDVEVLNLQLSEELCSEFNDAYNGLLLWDEFWSTESEVKKIIFSTDFDDASDYYRPYGID